jgi:hypothetical protein
VKSRKRQHADEPSRHEYPKKRRRVERPDGHWQYPREFWDRLSTIPLVRGALEELNRRTKSQATFPPPPTELAQDLAPTTTEELARFARHGGPDLRDLRGYTVTSNVPAGVMSSSSHSRATKSTNPTTIPTNPGTTKTKSSKSAYDRGFEQHLSDHRIYSTYNSEEPSGLGGIETALHAPRPSLSPSTFPVAAFKTFRAADAQAKDEEDVLHDVIPTIMGTSQGHIYTRKTKCTNLAPLTNSTIAPAYPDSYCGARPEELDRSVRDRLGSHIMPSTMADKPIVPNFFLEAKGPDGTPAVAKRQARYDGAMGARGMHSLQNYSEEEAVYDGNAYTFSSTYQGGSGTLQLYAHHVTAPTTPGGQPAYHMTQLDGYMMTGNRETFIRGATAFRNARDLAKKHRDSFIQAANAKAQRGDVEVSIEAKVDVPDVAEQQQDEGSSPGEFVDCTDYPSQDVDGNPPLPPMPLQDIAPDECTESQEANHWPALSEYVHEPGDQEDDAADDQADQEDVGVGWAPNLLNVTDSSAVPTSFASSFSSKPASKRRRGSLSPPSSKASHSHLPTSHRSKKNGSGAAGDRRHRPRRLQESSSPRRLEETLWFGARSGWVDTGYTRMDLASGTRRKREREVAHSGFRRDKAHCCLTPIGIILLLVRRIGVRRQRQQHCGSLQMLSVAHWCPERPLLL